MNIFLSEKPVGVSVVDFAGEPGAERPTVVRYTYSLDIEPDEVWLLCWRLPSTVRGVPQELQRDVGIEGELLSFTCGPDAHDRYVEGIGKWIIEANRQKDDLLSARESQAELPEERRAVVDRLTAKIAGELGIGDHEGGTQDQTRIEDW